MNVERSAVDLGYFSGPNPVESFANRQPLSYVTVVWMERDHENGQTLDNAVSTWTNHLPTTGNEILLPDGRRICVETVSFQIERNHGRAYMTPVVRGFLLD